MADEVRLIDANALHKEITSFDHSVIYKDWVQSAIASAPIISDVAPVVHGKWINALGNYQVAECSNCKKWFEPCPEEKPRKDFFECFCEDYKFCPNCGAKMDLEEQTV